MAVTTVVYGQVGLALASGVLSLQTDPIKGMLTTSAYTPDKDAHRYRSDVTNEVVGTGYTAGGQALVNKTLVYDPGNDRVVFDADDVTWPASNLTARKMVLYKDTGTAATSPLILCAENDVDLVSVAGALTFVFNVGGILRLNA